jgi:SAM-dependent methyltransferase
MLLRWRNHTSTNGLLSGHLLWPELFEPSVVQPAVEVLAELAGTGSALEFGIGTGRIAIPLSQWGVRVHGVELSAAMVAQLRTPARHGEHRCHDR